MSNTKRTNRKEGTMPTTIMTSGLTEFKGSDRSQSIFAEWKVNKMFSEMHGIDFFNFRVGSPGRFFVHTCNPFSVIPFSISYFHKREYNPIEISTVKGDPITFKKEDFDFVCEQIPQRTKEIVEMIEGMGEDK